MSSREYILIHFHFLSRQTMHDKIGCIKQHRKYHYFILYMHVSSFYPLDFLFNHVPIISNEAGLLVILDLNWTFDNEHLKTWTFNDLEFSQLKRELGRRGLFGISEWLKCSAEETRSPRSQGCHNCRNKAPRWVKWLNVLSASSDLLHRQITLCALLWWLS